MVPVRFEFEPKAAQINMRVPQLLLELASLLEQVGIVTLAPDQRAFDRTSPVDFLF